MPRFLALVRPTVAAFYKHEPTSYASRNKERNCKNKCRVAESLLGLFPFLCPRPTLDAPEHSFKTISFVFWFLPCYYEQLASSRCFESSLATSLYPWDGPSPSGRLCQLFPILSESETSKKTQNVCSLPIYCTISRSLK